MCLNRAVRLEKFETLFSPVKWILRPAYCEGYADILKTLLLGTVSVVKYKNLLIWDSQVATSILIRYLGIDVCLYMVMLANPHC